jgi:hypothetical protein
MKRIKCLFYRPKDHVCVFIGRTCDIYIKQKCSVFSWKDWKGGNK